MKTLYVTMTLALIFFASCSEDRKFEPSLRMVKYQPVYASTGVRLRTFAGVTQSGIESKLSFRVPGPISRLSVKVGDGVKKGDIIAQIDSTDYILQVQEVEAALMQTKAQERHAAASYARIQELYETRSTSRNELDASRAEAESASAAVDAMQIKLSLVRFQLSYATLKAPQEGSIASVFAEINENVGIGQQIVILNSGTNLEVKVSIPEILISQISKGEDVTVSFDVLPGKYYSGIVSEVGIASNVGTTFSVTVELTDSPQGMRSGMAAEVLFYFYDRELGNSFYLPSMAVVGVGDDHYVYVLNPLDDQLGIVEKRKVTIGELTNAGLEIVSGISEGELLITAGLHSLNDGQKVKMKIDG